MLLAARALGLGATLTTLYLQFEKEGRTPLAPRRPFLCPGANRLPDGAVRPVRRVALADVVYEDRWGQTYRDL
jgi:hypothetical protein